VHVGPLLRAQDGTSGRELEFIVRSLLELKLQVEELRRRIDDKPAHDGWIGEVQPSAIAPSVPSVSLPSSSSVTLPSSIAAIEPRDQPAPPNVVNITPGMTMAEIERSAIELVLRETRGNRRRAADMLGIGERTLYRKIKEYKMPEQGFATE
jgi:DNA-binding NtrC family response regulator